MGSGRWSPRCERRWPGLPERFQQRAEASPLTARQKIAGALLFGAAAAAALPRGGVPPWAQAALCLAAAAALALLADRAGSRARPAPAGAGRGFRWSQLAWAAPALVALLAALQCVPLPAAVLRALAPVSWELRTLAPAPPQAWAPLSLDPAATLSSLVLPVAAACAAAAAALLPALLRRLVCGAAVAAGLLQLAIGAVRAGVFAAALEEGQLTGSFVNRNHLAALLCLGALTALGAALERTAAREPGSSGRGGRGGGSAEQGAWGPGPVERGARVLRRLLWWLAAAALAAGALLTLSRGGAAALFAGAIALVLARAQGSRPGLDARGRSRLALAAAVLALVAALAVSEKLLARGGGGLREETKLRSFAGAAAAVRDHWLTGAGRGAYRFVSERHRSVPGEVTFVYVEDAPLQLAADLGAPAALAVLALLCAAWVSALRRKPGGLAQGALFGLFALALHNLVDFNLEIAGVLLPAAVSLGAVCGRPRLQRPALVALLVAAPLSCAALLWSQPRAAERESDALLALAEDAAVSWEQVEAAARAAVVRHPADWLTSLAPAVALSRRLPPRTGLALAWTGRAMQLAPEAWRPHTMAAAILLRAGARSQARLELRRALTGERYSLIPDALGLATRAAAGLEELLDATPDEPAVRAKLVERLRSEGRPDEARAVAEAELQRSAGGGGAGSTSAAAGAAADNSDAAARMTTDAAARIELERHLAALAFERKDGAELQRWAAALAADAPCEAALWRARALGPEAKVDAPLEEGLRLCPGDRALGEALVRARLARGDAPGAQAAFEALDAERPGSPWLIEAHLLHAELLEEQGHGAKGLAQRFLAAELAPEQAWLGVDYADRLARLGDKASARDALRRLSSRAPPAARAALETKLTELSH